jgi:hypothetical protein
MLMVTVPISIDQRLLPAFDSVSWLYSHLPMLRVYRTAASQFSDSSQPD